VESRAERSVWAERICKSALTSASERERKPGCQCSFSRLSGRIQAHLRSPSVSGFVVNEWKANRKGRSVGVF
jgi:hypothetical protein